MRLPVFIQAQIVSSRNISVASPSTRKNTNMSVIVVSIRPDSAEGGIYSIASELERDQAFDEEEIA